MRNKPRAAREKAGGLSRTEQWARRGILGLVVVLGVLSLWFTLREEAERRVIPTGSDIKLALKDLKPGRLRLISYAIDDSTTVRVAIQRGADVMPRSLMGKIARLKLVA
jgi:hypothetical protein